MSNNIPQEIKDKIEAMASWLDVKNDQDLISFGERCYSLSTPHPPTLRQQSWWRHWRE